MIRKLRAKQRFSTIKFQQLSFRKVPKSSSMKNLKLGRGRVVQFIWPHEIDNRPLMAGQWPINTAAEATRLAWLRNPGSKCCCCLAPLPPPLPRKCDSPAASKDPKFCSGQRDVGVSHGCIHLLDSRAASVQQLQQPYQQVSTLWATV